MSGEAMAYVRAQVIKPIGLKYYMERVAARIDNESGIAKAAKQGYLADELSVDVRTVRKLQGKAEELGYLVPHREDKNGKHGKFTINSYELPGFMLWQKQGKDKAREIFESALKPTSGTRRASGAKKSPEEGVGPQDQRNTQGRWPSGTRRASPYGSSWEEGKEDSESSFQSDSGASATDADNQADSNFEKGRHQQQSQQEADGGAGSDEEDDYFADWNRKNAKAADTGAGTAKSAGDGLKAGRKKTGTKSAGLPKNSAQRGSAAGTAPRPKAAKPAKAKQAAAGQQVAVRRGTVIEEITPEVITLERVDKPAGTEMMVDGRQVARRSEKPLKPANRSVQGTAAFNAWWRQVEKLPKGGLTHIRGRTNAWLSWEAIEDVDLHFEAIMAAMPVWAQRIAEQLRNGNTPCAADTWLDDRRWESMQPDGAKPDTVPADFTDFLALSKGLFSSGTDFAAALLNWSVLDEQGKDYRRRALRLRRRDLDAFMKEGEGYNSRDWQTGDSKDSVNVKAAQQRADVKLVKLDRWLHLGWAVHKVELDLEVPGFNCDPKHVRDFVSGWLHNGGDWADYLKMCFRPDEYMHKSASKCGLLIEWFGGIEPGLPGSRVPAEIFEAEKAKIIESMKGGTFELLLCRHFEGCEHLSEWNWGPLPGHPRCLVPASATEKAQARVALEKQREADGLWRGDGGRVELACSYREQLKKRHDLNHYIRRDEGNRRIDEVLARAAELTERPIQAIRQFIEDALVDAFGPEMAEMPF